MMLCARTPSFYSHFCLIFFSYRSKMNRVYYGDSFTPFYSRYAPVGFFGKKGTAVYVKNTDFKNWESLSFAFKRP